MATKKYNFNIKSVTAVSKDKDYWTDLASKLVRAISDNKVLKLEIEGDMPMGQAQSHVRRKLMGLVDEHFDFTVKIAGPHTLELSGDLIPYSHVGDDMPVDVVEVDTTALPWNE